MHMSKYGAKNQTEKSGKYCVLNVVITPVDSQKPERYTELIKKVKDNHVRINTFADKLMMIRLLFEQDGIIYGKLVNFVALQGNHWFNQATNDIVDVDVDPNLGPNSKEADFYFIPQAHRLAIKKNTKISLSQIQKFFELAFNEVTDENEEVIVNIVSTKDSIEKIIHANGVTRLYMRVSYSNNDNNEDFEAAIDKMFKEANITKATTELSGKPTNPIRLNENSYLGGQLRLCRENGYAEATVMEGGKRVKISTDSYPEVNEIRYIDEEDLLSRIKSWILHISRRDENV